MAHDLVFDNTGKAYMFYMNNDGKGVPWHGYGTPLDTPPTLEEAMRMIGAYDDLEIRRLTTQQGDVISTHRAVFDSLQGRIIGVVGKNYALQQRYQWAQALRPLIEEHGFTLDTGGLLCGGEKVFLSMQRGLEADVRPGDSVKSYVLAADGCTGKLATQLGVTDIRTVCNNTLTAAVGTGAFAKLKHRGDIAGRWETLVKAYECSFTERVEFFQSLAGRYIGKRELVEFIDRFTGKTEDQEKRAGGTRDTLTELFEDGIGSRSESLWDVYNAVTEMVSHGKGRGSQSVGIDATKDADRAARTLDSSLFGQGAAQTRKAATILAGML